MHLVLRMFIQVYESEYDTTYVKFSNLEIRVSKYLFLYRTKVTHEVPRTEKEIREYDRHDRRVRN